MTIEWRSIPDFPDYEVSNTGLVRSHKRGKPYILKPGNHPGGYRQVALRQNGKTHVFLVGHLVLLAFQGPCSEGCEMCHNDGNPTNDHLDNLRWDTHAANMQDASYHGAMRRTRKVENKAFVNAVRDIQREWKMTQGEFAEYIGINRASLSKFYIRGLRDNIIIKVLRRFPYLAYLFVSSDYDLKIDPHFRPQREHDEKGDIIEQKETDPILGKQIRILRLVRGISQEEFAKLVGVAYETVSMWENGHNIPRGKNLEKIKAILVWPPDDQAEVAFDILIGNKMADTPAPLGDERRVR